MAKIKFGLVVTDARNKLGGHVFSKNRAGAYLRTLVTPVNPRSSTQTSVRALFGQISKAWSELTEAQRNAWRSAVDSWKRTDVFGDLKRPDGKALHQRLNQQAQVVGYPAILTPDAPSEVASAIATGAKFEIGDKLITIAPISTSADSTIQLFATPKMSQGTQFVKDKLRVIYFAKGDVFTATDAYDGYMGRFGAPELNDNIHIGIRCIDANGNATPLQTLKATVEA